MDKSILITGASGLIGSNLVQLLNDQGYTKLILSDHLGLSEKWKNLSGKKYLDYLEKDDLLIKIQSDSKFMKQFQSVIHLGACSATTEKDATYLIKNNYEYTKLIALASVQAKAKFLYASSAATYGNGDNSYSDSVDIDKLKPLNMYGYSKHMFDQYCKRSGLDKKIIGLKYFNVYGFGEFHKGDMQSVVLKGYNQIIEQGKISLFRSYNLKYKDGEQKRDFLYAKDASEMTTFLMEKGDPGLYNIGSGVANTWNELASSLFSALGMKQKISYMAMPMELQKKYQYYTCADLTKLRSMGYKKEITPLKTAVADYVNRLRNNN
jgi:ADP-L-glycero-D-manno-heptose 6-epimerase